MTRQEGEEKGEEEEVEKEGEEEEEKEENEGEDINDVDIWEPPNELSQEAP